MKKLTTPYYLIDEIKLQRNLQIIEQVRQVSGVKAVLALKCFSTWSVFDLMRLSLDGTTSSSLYEARLGREEFGKEVHAYSVGFSKSDIQSVRKFADKVIFNSLSQLKMYQSEVKDIEVGLRINPGISYSHFDLADPARRYSRLGASDPDEIMKSSSLFSGVMFHFNCENDDVENICAAIDVISENYGSLLEKMQWVSLGAVSYTHLDVYKRQLLEMTDRLEAEAGHIEMTFVYFVNKAAPVSGVQSLMDYEVTFTGEIRAGQPAMNLKVVTPVTSLCPCSKKISQYGAHNQRSHVTISVRTRGFIGIEDLIDLCLLYTSRCV